MYEPCTRRRPQIGGWRFCSLAKPKMGVWLAEDLGGCVAGAGILTDRNRLLAHAGSWRCRLLAEELGGWR